jgi:hypothetical protein
MFFFGTKRYFYGIAFAIFVLLKFSLFYFVPENNSNGKYEFTINYNSLMRILKKKKI